MYKIRDLCTLETELKTRIKSQFVEFFTNCEHTKPSKLITIKTLKSLHDAETLYTGRGLYIITSNYQLYSNKCAFIVNDLKAIYRGHSYNVKNRLKSHLFNEHYRDNLPSTGVRYDVCMKLDNSNGINIDALPYSNYQWSIITYKMNGSSKLIREQAERAFDEVFSRPFACREP